MKSDNRKKILIKLEEIFLCLFIILAPINKSIGEISFFGVSLLVITILLLLALGVFNALIVPGKTSKNKHFAFFILTVFLIELLLMWFNKEKTDIGLLLQMSLFIYFITLCTKDKTTYICYCFYISTIISAVYSLIYGIANGSITRTATKIDGSIAVICVIVLLFLDIGKVNSFTHLLTRTTAFISVFIVAGFGMSRSRILIICMLFILYFAFNIKKILTTGKITIRMLIQIIILFVAVYVVFEMSFSNSLLSSIIGRFSDGLQSEGRSEEIALGLKLFENHGIAGAGWGKIFYTDYSNYYGEYNNHCMYVAILARGGLLMGIPFLFTFVSLLKSVVKSKDLFCIITLITFFVLAYGNAGLFNYTILSFLIPVSLRINRNKADSEIDSGDKLGLIA